MKTFCGYLMIKACKYEKILSSATSFLVAYQLLSASRILGIVASGRLLQKTEMFVTLQIRYKNKHRRLLCYQKPVYAGTVR